MKLQFLGAAREVTGSCTLVEAAGHRFLVDCGMEQGKDLYENTPLPCAPAEIEAILLTHAHIDHSGRIPYLYKNGFRGPIYATDATMDLCEIMLEDSAHIQEQEAEWKNRKAQRSGRAPVEPEYTTRDAEEAMRLFVPQQYSDGPVRVFDGVEAEFTDVGHLLGSASITLRVTENGRTQTIVFSGDIGNKNQPLLRDPHYLTTADFVVMESTYGDRDHPPRPDYLRELTDVLQSTFDRGGNVVIPSFAVGRTQELLYFIRQIKAEGRIHGHDGFPVYVDSPLANRSTTVFRENYSQCYDEDALALIRAGQNPLSFPGLCISQTKEDSIAINADATPKVIISASGMCDAGRIRHHLKHNLWRKECTILFVGYQAAGTLGRALLEGADEVRLFGEDVQVNAQIRQMTGLSGHADRTGLEQWIASFSPRPAFVFVQPRRRRCGRDLGRPPAQRGLHRRRALQRRRLRADRRPRPLCLEPGIRERIQKPAAPAKDVVRTSPAFERLVNMGKRLLVVIEHNRGGANKDLAKFASQIQALCDKWDR